MSCFIVGHHPHPLPHHDHRHHHHSARHKTIEIHKSLVIIRYERFYLFPSRTERDVFFSFFFFWINVHFCIPKMLLSFFRCNSNMSLWRYFGSVSENVSYYCHTLSHSHTHTLGWDLQISKWKVFQKLQLFKRFRDIRNNRRCFSALFLAFNSWFKLDFLTLRSWFNLQHSSLSRWHI